MRVRFSFRTEKQSLPDAVTLMETTRKIHNEMKENPHTCWRKYEKWIKSMNQLQNGLFFSINWDDPYFNFQEYCHEESNLVLEFSQLGPNYAKIMFEYTEALPYRVPSGKITTKPATHLKVNLDIAI